MGKTRGKTGCKMHLQVVQLQNLIFHRFFLATFMKKNLKLWVEIPTSYFLNHANQHPVSEWIQRVAFVRIP